MTTELMNTAQEDVTTVQQTILARHPRMDAQRSGTLVNTVAGAIAMEGRRSRRFALREMMRYLFSTAQGADLDTLASDRRGLDRLAATSAIGDLRVSRSVDGGAITIPAASVFTDPDGARYLLVAETVWTGLQRDLEVIAELTGPTTNRTSGLSWSAGGADWTDGISDLTITNPESMAGGNDAETDGEFRDRIGQHWQTLQRATTGALAFAALSVDGIRRATVDESHIAVEDGGWVDVYATDGSDGMSAALRRLVIAAIDDYRAAGVVCNVYGATVVNQGITVSFTQSAGGPADAVARAAAAVLRYVNNLAIGTTLRRSQIVAAALGADSSLVDCVVSVPAADVAPAAGQVIRCPAEMLLVS